MGFLERMVFKKNNFITVLLMHFVLFFLFQLFVAFSETSVSKSVSHISPHLPRVAMTHTEACASFSFQPS